MQPVMFNYHRITSADPQDRSIIPLDWLVLSYFSWRQDSSLISVAGIESSSLQTTNGRSIVHLSASCEVFVMTT